MFYNFQGQSQGTQSTQSSNSSQSSDADPDTNLTTLRLLESQSRSLSSSTHSHLLSSEQRKSFKGLILVAKDMIKNGKISKGNLSSNLAKIVSQYINYIFIIYLLKSLSMDSY